MGRVLRRVGFRSGGCSKAPAIVGGFGVRISGFGLFRFCVNMGLWLMGVRLAGPAYVTRRGEVCLNHGISFH